MPLIGYSDHDLQQARFKGELAGHAAAVSAVLADLPADLLANAHPLAQPPCTPQTLAQFICLRWEAVQTELSTLRSELTWFKRERERLLAEPLRVQRDQALAQARADRARLDQADRDLARLTARLAEEQTEHVDDVLARDAEIADLNRLLAELSLEHLDGPAGPLAHKSPA